MASEIRVDKITSLSGVGTITPSSSGIDITGITTIATLKATTGIVTTLTATTGIVTTLTANTVTSLGAVSGTTGTFSGDVSIADKIVHTGDTNTAIRFPAADALTIETGGSETFRITGAGATISTNNSNDSELTVEGTGGATVHLKDSGSGEHFRLSANGQASLYAVSSMPMVFYTGGVASGNERLRIASTGEVSMGGFAPTAGDGVLQIAGGLRVAGSASASDTTSPYIYRTSGADNLNFATSGVERLRIDSSGLLLVGTTDSGYPSFADNLTLADSAHCGITLRSGTSSQGNIYFSDGTGTSEDTYRGMITYVHGSNNYMSIATNTVERVRIDSSGNVDVKTGNLVIGTSGKGIDFSATSDGSGTNSSELLDDYEEGTFTPTVTSGMSSPVYAIQRGGYTKVGRFVYFQIDISIDGGSGDGNQFRFGGLPFTSRSGAGTAYGGASINYQNNFLGKGEDVSLHVGLNDNQVKLYTQVGGNCVGNDSTAIPDITSNVILQGTYMTA